MPCVKPDGSLTTRALDILEAVLSPCSEEEVAGRIRQPLYRARAMLRELEQQGLLVQEAGLARITDAGRGRLGAED